MTFKEKFLVAPEFESLFNLSEKDKNEVEALILAAQFLSQITDVLNERNITRKQLAQYIGVSASWLTQIFRGDKLPNWETLAKIKNYLEIDFEIKLQSKAVSAIYTEEEKENRANLTFPKQYVFSGLYKNLRPDLTVETDEMLRVPKKDYPMMA